MACSLVLGPGITAITGEDIMDAATAGVTTDAATMGVATTAAAEMPTDPDTVTEGDAVLQAAAIAAGSVEVDFAAMVADSTAEIAADSAAEAFAAETVSTVAEAVAFMEAVADSTAAVIAVEDPTVVAIGNFELNTGSLRDRRQRKEILLAGVFVLERLEGSHQHDRAEELAMQPELTLPVSSPHFSKRIDKADRDASISLTAYDPRRCQIACSKIIYPRSENGRSCERSFYSGADRPGGAFYFYE